MAWNPHKNSILMQRAVRLAVMMQDIREEIERLEDIIQAEGVFASPEFVDVGGLPKADVQAFLVGVAMPFRNMVEGQAVTAGERRLPLARVLGTQTT